MKVLFDYVSFFSQKKMHHSKWVSVSDFTEFLSQSEIVPNYISEKEAYLIFIHSIQIQIEELKHPRHFQMHLIEFMEAIARIAEYLSPVSPYSSMSELISMD